MSKKHYISLIILTFLVFLSFVQTAEAQSSILYFSPASGSFAKGESFWVTILIDTKGELVNAVAAYLSYPEDKLEALGVNTTGSVMTLWAEENAKAGTINLAGGKPAPGFSGYQKIASIGFKVKVSSGSVTLKFNEDSVILRNSDNQNTLNLSQSGQGNYTFKSAALPSTPIIPSTPQITQPSDIVDEALKPKDSESLTPGYQVEIIVLNNANARPITGAEVILPGPPKLTEITNEKGEVTFSNLSLGKQQITIIYENTSLHGAIEVLQKEGVQRFDIKFQLPRSGKTQIILIAGGIIAFITLIIIFRFLRRKPSRNLYTPTNSDF